MCGNRAVVVAASLALALTGVTAGAQAGRRGGGGRPGGGHSGGAGPRGGYAVPRGGGAPSRPVYPARGGVATARHPQAGTGYGSYRYGGRYPYTGRYRYYGYYPYRGYYPYYGYYRPYPYFSFSFGWPYYASTWWPYGYATYYSPSYSVSHYGSPDPVPDAPPLAASPRETGRIRLEVRPEDASVYVDDEFRGNGRETKFLTLRPGRHSVELVRPGFVVDRREVDVTRGETTDVFVELQR